jgi:hypothetical protein
MVIVLEITIVARPITYLYRTKRDSIPEDMLALFEMCVVDNPDDRPTMDEVVNYLHDKLKLSDPEPLPQPKREPKRSSLTTSSGMRAIGAQVSFRNGSQLLSVHRPGSGSVSETTGLNGAKPKGLNHSGWLTASMEAAQSDKESTEVNS